MSTTIHEVLGELRAAALDERDKGDKFERLVQVYLRDDPEWAARFSDIWLWSDWPGRAGRPDTGIDLVAANRERDDYTAIQCKFYEADRTVSKGDIDSFISASGKKEFSQRYIFDTAKSWSPNATSTLEGLSIPVQRVDISYLDEAHFDWSQYSWTTPEVLVPTGKKGLRPHQQAALDNVRQGLAAADRGKLIMACGTGKTFTSLRIAEDLVGVGGSVLFLVPSIQLLSQSLREWMAEAQVDIRPFAVCSDVRVGRRVNSDDADMSIIDLTEPATTDAETLVARLAVGTHARERMTVVFSTYQSIDVIAQAQQQGLPQFDLVVCDEAHRTTGVTIAGGDESAFVKVHDNAFLRAAKRLYMTATPRVFGEEVRRKATEAEAVLADMNDADTYGEELHRLGFGDAVEADLLTDYKVLVLAVDEGYVAENFQSAMSVGGEIALGDAAKLIGCWNGLAKHYGTHTSEEGSRLPMRRAVAFAKDIKTSKTAAASFPALVDRALLDESTAQDSTRNRLHVEAAHVDGTIGIHERNAHLTWLKQSTSDNVCRVLSNARCLSEGVDVPALDAVLFLTPRGSQVDVVQSVGRVMRKAPGKELGYIILPIVVPTGVAPEDALKDNERYRVVWQVLQALRSHDDRFHAMINQIELNKNKTNRLIIDLVAPRPKIIGGDHPLDDPARRDEQLLMDYGFDGFRDAMYAKIVQKVGERRYWETWARDVAEIAKAHITRIKGLLADPDSGPALGFAEFLTGLRGNLNESITPDEAIEMLAQHLITRPVFKALFDDYDFALHNPVAKTMELMLASLNEQSLETEQASLDRFYASVRRRAEGLDNGPARQQVIVELYDKFFATAFKRTVDRLGIVYTPVEIVDFILNSADQILRQEFGRGLTDKDVHILDGFTGTGTFITRLLMSDLIEPHDLARKYANELHANEILLLAYYIAAVNIETTYAAVRHDLRPVLGIETDEHGEELPTHEPFPGLVLTDTFQSYEDSDRDDLEIFPENNERIVRQRQLPITVILGNPPYSVGQDSANDDNANAKYRALDDAINQSFVERSAAALSRNMYDSYIRAFKWASLRLKDRGVVAYVTNGGFLDSNSADGMRKSLADEFTSIYVYNLRGNARTAGDQRQREGGTVFGGGSRATVAITLLVKNPALAGATAIRYADIGDYFTRDEKLGKIAAASTILDVPTTIIEPNEHGDWLNQRRGDFRSFMPLRADRGSAEPSLFSDSSLGISTNRDAWVYNFSADKAAETSAALIATYEGIRQGSEAMTEDPRQISWSAGLRSHLVRNRALTFDDGALVVSAHRPFTKNWLYSGQGVIERPGRTMLFAQDSDMSLKVLTPIDRTPFSALMLADVPNLNFFMDALACFPRLRPAAIEEGQIDFGSKQAESNITDEAHSRFTSAYPARQVTKDDIFFYTYGLLHSPVYRETYAADLKKMLPRIPLVREFRAYVDAGQALAQLHLSYEGLDLYPLEGLDDVPQGDPYEFYCVAKKMTFGKALDAQRAAGGRFDRSVIHYNDRITISGIPEEAYRYHLGSRSAIEWIIDRYYVKTDKASGIVNDPNDWSREVGDPRYILDLLARVVTVSVETMKIVDRLPALDIIEGA